MDDAESANVPEPPAESGVAVAECPRAVRRPPGFFRPTVRERRQQCQNTRRCVVSGAAQHQTRGRSVQPRTALLAFFSRFAARFSIRLLAGFLFTSFLVSFALLMVALPRSAVRQALGLQPLVILSNRWVIRLFGALHLLA